MLRTDVLGFRWEAWCETLDPFSFVLKRVPQWFTLKDIDSLLPKGLKVPPRLRLRVCAPKCDISLRASAPDAHHNNALVFFNNPQDASRMPSTLNVTGGTQKPIICTPRTIGPRQSFDLISLKQLEGATPKKNTRFLLHATLPSPLHTRVPLFKLSDLGAIEPHILPAASPNESLLICWASSPGVLLQALQLLERTLEEANKELHKKTRREHSYTTSHTGRVLLPERVHSKPFRRQPKLGAFSNPTHFKTNWHLQLNYWKRQERVLERIVWRRQLKSWKTLEPTWYTYRTRKQHHQGKDRLLMNQLTGVESEEDRAPKETQESPKRGPLQLHLGVTSVSGKFQAWSLRVDDWETVLSDSQVVALSTR